MNRSATIPREDASVTQGKGRSLAKTDPRTRDRILTAVGRAWSANGLKASAAAKAFGWSESQESRIRSGQRASAASHAAEAVYLAAQDARRLEAAGFSSAHIEVLIKVVAMWPELDRLSTEELYQELRDTIRYQETRANGECNNLEADYIYGGHLNASALLHAYTLQAAATERAVAILQLIESRKE